MHILNPQTQPQRLTRILDESWEILAQRIATGRVSINKEASLQLHYSSILLSYGELFCVEPRETFSIELESASGRKSIDITCALGDTRAAIELKRFRKASNRACVTVSFWLAPGRSKAHRITVIRITTEKFDR